MDSTTSTPDVVATPALVFRVGGESYACETGFVREIIPFRGVTRLPGAPAFVRGLINVRGTIVTILDLGVRLDAERKPVQDGSILLVRNKERIVGVVVDEVADVRMLDVETSSPSGEASIMRGAANLDGVPVLLLDFDVLIQQVLQS